MFSKRPSKKNQKMSPVAVQYRSSLTYVNNRRYQERQLVSTPPGFNKERRDISKMLLAVTTFCLFLGSPMVALLTSVGAIFVLKEGTFWSVKNIKWSILSIISVCISLCCWLLREGYHYVDEERAYGLKTSLWLANKFLQVGWSTILGIFLLSAFTPLPSPSEYVA